MEPISLLPRISTRGLIRFRHFRRAMLNCFAQRTCLELVRSMSLTIARKVTYQGSTSLENVINGAFAGYKKLDLTGVKKATLHAFVLDPAQNPGGEIEIRLDKPDGKLLGKVNGAE